MKDAISQPTPVTGAAMDTIVPQQSGKKFLIGAGCSLLLLVLTLSAWRMIPQGLQVPATDVRIAGVEKGVFYDDITVRTKAEALHSVILDAVESGRVEEVVARDGSIVKQGEVLFRISNSELNLELLQRQSEHAQQIANVSNLRVALETADSEHERRLLDLKFNLLQEQRKHARFVPLAEKGLISTETLDASSDALAKQEHALDQENARYKIESRVQRDAIAQMESAIKTIESGLALVGATVDALVVRAPIAGRLADFRLQVGETVKKDDHFGHIDDPDKFKLTARVDEYYLNRVAVGCKGSVRLDGKDLAISVSRVFPQIKDGHFSIELVFDDSLEPVLQPGQSLDAQITLGQPNQALLLPNAPFLSDSGGAWVFVVAANGVDAEKRMIRCGRRNSRQLEVLSGLAAGESVIVSSYASFGNVTRLQLKK